MPQRQSWHTWQYFITLWIVKSIRHINFHVKEDIRKSHVPIIYLFLLKVSTSRFNVFRILNLKKYHVRDNFQHSNLTLYTFLSFRVPPFLAAGVLHFINLHNYSIDKQIDIICCYLVYQKKILENARTKAATVTSK